MMLILSLFVAVVAAEYLLRAYYSRFGKIYVWPPYQYCTFHLDPQALPRLEKITRFDTNSLGEIGGEVPKGRVWRALVVGGSAAECYYLGSDHGWPLLMQNRLSAPGTLQLLGADAVHVGNIAKSGVCSASLQLILKSVLPQYPRFDLIVCMVGASDVLRWMTNGAPESGESAPLDQHGLFALNQRRKYSWPKPSNLAAAEALRGVKRKYLNPRSTRHEVGRTLTKVRAMRAGAKHVLDDVASPFRLIARFRGQLACCLEECRKSADRVILVRQPWFDREPSVEEAGNFWNASIGHPFTQQVDTYFSLRVLRECMRLLDQALIEVAHGMGVECVDLKEAVPSDLSHFYDCFHFTPLGAEAVAAEMVRQITAPLKRRDSDRTSVDEMSPKKGNW